VLVFFANIILIRNALADDWITRFLKLHDEARLRIYVHMLLIHGKDLYDIYGPLRWLSNQV
jgi:hypothetical protein